MKHVVWIASLTLMLTACGRQEPADTAADPLVEAAEQQPIEDTVEGPEETAAEPTDDTLEVVEESAAEPDAEEQPILLARAEDPAASHDWQFKEGTHYHRMVPSQPTMGGADKIEVAEFFWYGCSHCYDFEPFINRWDADKPANARFVRIPVTWNDAVALHARLFYTKEVLARNGVIEDPEGFHEAVFQEFHRRGNRLTSKAVILRLFQRFGVSEDDFESTWKSFEVDQKLRVAADLARRYNVANVPTVVVNGKYRTGGAEAGSYPKLIDVIDELIERESIR